MRYLFQLPVLTLESTAINMLSFSITNNSTHASDCVIDLNLHCKIQLQHSTSACIQLKFGLISKTCTTGGTIIKYPQGMHKLQTSQVEQCIL